LGIAWRAAHNVWLSRFERQHQAEGCDGGHVDSQDLDRQNRQQRAEQDAS